MKKLVLVLMGLVSLGSPVQGQQALPADKLTATIRIQAAQPLASPAAGMLTLIRRTLEGQNIAEERVTREITVPGELVIPLAKGNWELSLSGGGLYAKNAWLSVDGQARAPVELRAWPLARIGGRLKWPAGEKAPESLAVKFTPAGSGDTRKEPQGELPCTLQTEGTFFCEVPATSLDLRLRAPRFVSHYRWGFQPKGLKEAGQAGFGTLSLQPGASLVGWVVSAEGSSLPQGTTVSVIPAGVGESGALLKHTATPLENGFFHFESLAPGAWQVTAKAPGLSEAAAAVKILERTEAQLRDPLELAKPMEISISLSPPVAPDQNPWRLGFQQLDLYRNTVLSERKENVPTSGLWQGTGFRPSVYLVTVYSADERQRYLARQIDFATAPLPVVLEVEVVKARGQLLLAGKGTEASLVFGGRHRTVKVEVATAADGSFEVELPQPGTWDVEVESPLVRAMAKTEVPAPKGGAPVEIEISLPDTAIAGKVVDEKGEPLLALVQVVPLESDKHSFAIDSREDGTFDILALDENVTYSLQAETEQGKSEPALIRVAAGEPSADVELVVRKLISFESRLQDPLGRPIPGVQLIIMANTDPFGGASAFSGPDGRFQASIPADSREVVVHFMAPGWVMGVEKLPVKGGGDIVLTPNGGTLVLDSLSAAEGWAQLLYREGIQFGPVQRWLKLQQQDASARPIAIPNLQPGYYQVCRIPAKESAFWTFGPQDPQRCSGGFLMPGGVLELGLGSTNP